MVGKQTINLIIVIIITTTTTFAWPLRENLFEYPPLWFCSAEFGAPDRTLLLCAYNLHSGLARLSWPRAWWWWWWWFSAPKRWPQFSALIFWGHKQTLHRERSSAMIWWFWMAQTLGFVSVYCSPLTRKCAQRSQPSLGQMIYCGASSGSLARTSLFGEGAKKGLAKSLGMTHWEPSYVTRSGWGEPVGRPTFAHLKSSRSLIGDPLRLDWT